jgi:plasmid stabilization system protein ParE
VAHVIVTERALNDIDRVVDFLLEAGAPAAARRARECIVDGLRILERHPEVGRPAPKGLRELIISFGRSGYVAVYRHRRREQLVLVLALRHQREVLGDE